MSKRRSLIYSWARDTVADTQIAVRRLGRSRGFTGVAIAIIGLGVGLATAVFTVANALLIRKLPVADERRIVILQGETPDGRTNNVPLRFSDVREYARATRTLHRVAWFLYNGAAPVTLRDADRISRLQVSLVSGNYFDVLGARPLLGRTFRDGDDQPGAAPAIVLSHRAWQRLFGAASNVVGRRLFSVEDTTVVTVVGVMPPGLDFPRGADAWMPVRAAMRDADLRLMDFDVLARLAPGATPNDARQEMTAFFRRHYPGTWMADVRGVARALPELVLGDSAAAVLAFAAAAGLLLLITCINIANLLLVRGLARSREIAVLTALGASRYRIVRQLCTEHALLALAGGVLGIAIASAALGVFVAVAPPTLPRIDEIHSDAAMLVAACSTTFVATLLFALGPAVLTSRVDALAALRSGTRQTGTRRSRSLGETLVAGQIALAVIVLAAAGLIGRSLAKLQSVDLAFHPARVMVAELLFRAQADDDAKRQSARLQRLVSAIENIPGVEAVSPVVSVPYSTTRSWEGVPAPEGQSREEAARNPMVDIEVVSPSFFATLGLPVLRGRGFTDADGPGATPVMVVSASIARRFWPNENPIGKRLIGAGGRVTIVGIVPETRYRDLREKHATIYYPLRQSAFPFPPTTLLIRSVRPPGDLVALLRRTMAETTPQIALASAEPFDELLAGPLAQPRTNALLLGIFAAAALVLAVVGLFGVLATMVRQRQREIGVRMALGASSTDVARLVLRRGVVLAGAGTSIGCVGALIMNQLLRALLFEVSPADPAVLGGSCVLLLAVALVAAWLPARRATRIEPVSALQAE